jgi:hypothetical protein
VRVAGSSPVVRSQKTRSEDPETGALPRQEPLLLMPLCQLVHTRAPCPGLAPRTRAERSSASRMSSVRHARTKPALRPVRAASAAISSRSGPLGEAIAPCTRWRAHLGGLFRTAEDYSDIHKTVKAEARQLEAPPVVKAGCGDSRGVIANAGGGESSRVAVRRGDSDGASLARSAIGGVGSAHSLDERRKRQRRGAKPPTSRRGRGRRRSVDPTPLGKAEYDPVLQSST